MSLEGFDFLYFLTLLHRRGFSAQINSCDDNSVSVVIDDGEHFVHTAFDITEPSILGDTNLIMFRAILMAIEKLNAGIGDDTEFVTCSCGGLIINDGHEQPGTFRCSKCRRIYMPQELEYDKIIVNHETGWVFPVKWKEK